MKPRQAPSWRGILATACLACMAGCATSPPPRADITHIAPAATQSLVTVGQNKADVIATLGKTKTLRFDSGVEVWVYYYSDPGAGIRQPPQADGNAEFIVLFSPSGKVLKTRIRPVPPPSVAPKNSGGS
ncbi:hypothetical protein ACO0LO_09975 [Undibacterium sp. TJN25]|uniref:hypothetical protein n=1 Tax=Undibacterium sp. TJN25 TaxID=3413056 RepID=UPI003BF11332